MIKNKLGVLVECTHPIVNQIRHIYTKWLIHPFVSSTGVASNEHDKFAVQVGYCKVCDKIVMKDSQMWEELAKVEPVKEEAINEEVGTKGE